MRRLWLRGFATSAAIRKDAAAKASLRTPFRAKIKEFLRTEQPAEALQVFKENLQKADPLALTECVRLFGDKTTQAKGPYMLQALRLLLETGYTFPFQSFTRLVKTVPISTGHLEDIAQDAKAPLIRDEDTLIAVMQLYANAGNSQAVEALFERFREALEKDGRHIQPNTRAWEIIIAAAGATGDITAAHRWFDAWRRSPAHPYGHMEALQEQIKAYKKTNAHKRKARKIGTLFNPESLPLTSTGPSLDFIRAAHLMRPCETPEPGPYIALLKVYSENTRLGDKTAIAFIRFMAAERIATNVRLVNGLMHYELSRGEPSMTASVLGLYEGLHRKSAEPQDASAIDPVENMRPDSTTFLYAFRAYRERKQQKPKDPAPLPTQLARLGGIPTPSDDLLINPRRLLLDFLSSLSSDVQPSTQHLNDALKAFIDMRDFAGATIILQLFAPLSVEPCSRTHAVVVHGALRAADLGEAFGTPSAKSWLNSERVASLLQRVGNLNELAGYTLFGQASPNVDVQVMEIQATEGPESSYTITHRKAETESPAFWNGRLEPRTEEELREVRRYEYGSTGYLVSLLEQAGASDCSARSWTAQLCDALHDTVPPALQRAVSFSGISTRSTDMPDS